MTRLVVTEHAARHGVGHPLACIVRKYGDGLHGGALAGRVDALKRAAMLVARPNGAAVMMRGGDSLRGEIWLDCITPLISASPLLPHAADGLDVFERSEDSTDLRPLPALTYEARTAVLIVIGAGHLSGETTRGYAMDLLHHFKQDSPSAYAQLLPTIPVRKAGI